MIIYNVTVNIEESIHDEWLEWIKNHIPQVLATGKFIDARLTKVLVEEEMGGTTYAIQYKAKSREALGIDKTVTTYSRLYTTRTS